MCEFNVIRNEGTFDFSKYRKEMQSLKGCIFLGAIKITGILILGRLLTTH
jgi:hypothetical protein